MQKKDLKNLLKHICLALLANSTVSFAQDVPYYTRDFQKPQDIGAINQNFRDLADRKDLLSNSDAPSEYEQCIFNPIFSVNQYENKIKIVDTSIFISTSATTGTGVCFPDGTCQTSAGVGSSAISANASQFSGNGSIASPLTLVSSSVTLQGNTITRTYNGVTGRLLGVNSDGKLDSTLLPANGYSGTYLPTGQTVPTNLVDLSTVTTALSGKVSKSGDEMTGALTMNASSITIRYTGNAPLSISQNSTVISDILSNTGLSMIGADNTATRFGLRTYGIAGSGAYAQRRARGTAAGPSAVANGDQLLSLEGWGYGATGWLSSPNVMVRGWAADTWTDSYAPTYLSLWTTQTLVPAERMRITAVGNVGISTTAPVNTLGVSGGITATSSITAQSGFFGSSATLTDIIIARTADFDTIFGDGTNLTGVALTGYGNTFSAPNTFNSNIYANTKSYMTEIQLSSAIPSIMSYDGAAYHNTLFYPGIEINAAPSYAFNWVNASTDSLSAYYFTTGPDIGNRFKFDKYGLVISSGLRAGASNIDGTGGVNIINSDGKIPALTSAYFANLDGSALTGMTDDTRVLKSGDVMTGPLHVQSSATFTDDSLRTNFRITGDTARNIVIADTNASATIQKLAEIDFLQGGTAKKQISVYGDTNATYPQEMILGTVSGQSGKVRITGSSSINPDLYITSYTTVGLNTATPSAGYVLDANGYINSTGYYLNGSAFTSEDSVARSSITAIYSVMSDIEEPTGFYVDGASSMTLTGRIFSISTMSGVSYSIYYKGIKHTKSSDTITIPNATGLNWIYFTTGAVLSQSTSFPGFDTCLVAAVYYSTYVGTGFINDERHTSIMDWRTHEYVHETIGSRWASGMTGTFSATAGTVTAGEFYDDDLEIQTIQTIRFKVLYKNNTGTDYKFYYSTNPYYYGGGTLYYLNGSSMTAVTSNRYVVYWVVATSDRDNPFSILPGTREDTTLANARANNTVDTISYTGFTTAEVKVLYRVIMLNSGTPAYVETTDYRNVSSLPSGNYVANSHASLTNLDLASSGHPYDSTGGFASYDGSLRAPATFYVVKNTDYLVAPASFSYLTAPATFSYLTAPATFSFMIAPATFSYLVAPATFSYLRAPATFSYLISPATFSYLTAPATFSYLIAPASFSYLTAPATFSYLVAPASFTIVSPSHTHSYLTAPATFSYLISPATFSLTSTGGSGGASWVEQNFYANTNGSQTQFTLTQTPLPNSLRLTKNGVTQAPGATYDYTLSGVTITMNTAPASSTTLVANYAVADSSFNILSTTNTFTASQTFSATGAGVTTISSASITSAGITNITRDVNFTNSARITNAYIDIGVNVQTATSAGTGAARAACATGYRAIGCGSYGCATMERLFFSTDSTDSTSAAGTAVSDGGTAPQSCSATCATANNVTVQAMCVRAY